MQLANVGPENFPFDIHAYSMLKTRFEMDIHDLFFNMDTNELTKAEYANEQFRCMKLLTVGRLMFTRGPQATADEMLKEAAGIAKKYELAAEYIMIANIRRKIDGNDQGVQAYDSYSAEIENYMEILKQQLFAEESYYKFTLPNYFNKNKEFTFKDHFNKVLPVLEESFYKNGSAHVGQFLFLMQYYQFEVMQEYEKAYDKAMELLKLTEERPALRSKPKIATVKIQAATMLLYMYRYNECTNMILDARQNLRETMLNYLNATEIAFLSAFYKKDYEKADEFMQQALKHPLTLKPGMPNDKWEFYRANLLYVTGKAGKALNILSKLEEITTDKSGWNIGIKLLEMYIYYDIEKPVFGYRLDNFRKKLADFPNMNLERMNLIRNICYALDNNKKGLSAKNKKDFELLFSQKGPYRWNQMGFEVIPFHEWVKDKL